MYNDSTGFQHRRGCGGCWGSWMHTTWTPHPAQHWTASHLLRRSPFSRRFSLCLCSGTSREGHEFHSWFQLICLDITQFMDHSTASLILLLQFSFTQRTWSRSQWPLAGWDCGFESRQRRRCLSLVSVVWCQVEISASSWSLVQGSPTACGVSECDREASTMRRPWPTGGCCAG